MLPHELFEEGDTFAFLASFTAHLSDTAYLSLTALPSGATRFPPAAQPNVAVALARGRCHLNHYVSVGAFDYRPDKGRGRADQVRWLVGLPVDVDVEDGSGAHRAVKRSAPLASSAEDALEAMLALPVFPSLVWHTGHGVQGVVLLDPPLDVRAERDRARALMAGWSAALVEASRRTNVAFDDVADLVRLVRLPGTVNVKVPDDPRPVRLLDGSAERARHPGDVEALLPRQAPPPRQPNSRPSLFDDDVISRWSRSVDWSELLTPAGWVEVGQRDGVRLWRRPGKHAGQSATTGWRKDDSDIDLLHVFTSADDSLAPGWFSKVGVYAALHAVDVREVLSAIRSAASRRPS